MKKYLFFVSIIFFVIIGAHLCSLYLYEGAEETPIEGGTISEAIVGSFPHLNPLLPSSDYNKYINSILYRSLLKYNVEEQKIEGDLANCDISNLIYIECYLENNILWSNGDQITAEDIIATLNLIEKTNVNPGISALLENTTIEKGNGKIIFNNAKKDINFLNVFFQPILPEDITNNLHESTLNGNFSPIAGVYSGKYVLSSVNQDETVGITKMTFTKNESYFQNDAFLDTIILKIFKNNAHFLKHKNSVNVFNDKENILGASVPRLKSFSYALPQFVGIFLNQEKLEQDNLRAAVLDGIERELILNEIGDGKATNAINPFITEESIDTVFNGDIEALIKEKGFFSKVELMKKSLDLRSETQDKISDEAPTQEIIVKKQEALNYIVSPTTQKYNFVSQDNILLKGTVDVGVTGVFINDYQLQGFSIGDEVFHYRLSENYETIQEGENTYEIHFEFGKDGEKQLKEEIVYIYHTDTEKLQEIEDTFFGEGETETSEEDSTTEAEETQVVDVPETIQDQDVITGEEGELNIDPSSLENLDERFYYTTDGDAFKIKLVYVNSDADIETAARNVKSQLEEIGVFIELLPLSLSEITRGLRDESLTYDAILIGINLGYFDSNIFPYFHSSQVKNGYNFGNYKQLGLDILLEELKSNNLTPTKKQELQTKVLDILQKSSIVKVLYSPKVNLLVDKNLQGFSLNNFLPDEIHRFDPLLKSYLTKKKIISTEEKSFGGFIKFLLDSFL